MIVYKPENTMAANVWYYVLKVGAQYLLMGVNNLYGAERIIRPYSTQSAAVFKALNLNRKTGAERG